MFGITSDDISRLDDEQLHELVALLSEAEVRRRGYSTAAVTWGGDQNAKDGGVDVRVMLPENNPIDGFVPRRSTGFQAKAQDMQPHSIESEMCPKGVLRPAIAELAQAGGAYIIVSSQGSTSDIALANRRNAMAEAVLGIADRLALDFYDRTRIATWVRNHAGLIVWVRRAIGREIQGWAPFGAWAYPEEGPHSEYLFDQGVRIRPRPATAEGDVSADVGLKQIRDILRKPAGVVRLVGLSGVGKTRFVQALFDSRIADEGLDPSLAVYTNMNDEPNPTPVSLASDLIANSTRAVLVVDNCAPELHGRLSEIVKQPSSTVSVLTVEYDIREDQPEGTQVFEVQVASKELIEMLLTKRFPRLSQVDVRSASEFSGGNARIAIALANTVEQSGTLDRLTNHQLFQRLFVQRQDQDKNLLEIAQVCSLVYSFNGEDLTNGEEGELSKLAEMAGVTTEDVYKAVAELLRRDLIQKRGVWRAILPHAVANSLAATALQNIPLQRVKDGLTGKGERLAKSFSRRLGYLHTSDQAVTIVREWLEPKGWIGEHVWNLNEFGKSVFLNIVSVDPEAALRAVESSVPNFVASPMAGTGTYLPRVLRSIAYDAITFERCVALLQTIARFGDATVAKEASETHTSLFSLYLSGTHASIEQRAAAAKKLLLSSEAVEREMGLAALSAMLRTSHFSSQYEFQFGTRSRDYGYVPKINGDIWHWLRTALALASEFVHSDGPMAQAMQTKMAEKFRGLWSVAVLRPDLETMFLKIAATHFWPEGWLAVKQTRYYDEKDKTSDVYAQLSKLEEAMRPVGLIQRIRGRVLSPKRDNYDIDAIDFEIAGGFAAAIKRNEDEAEALGAELAKSNEQFQTLLPEIVSSTVHLWHFGIGLAKGAADAGFIWQELTKQFAKTSESDRRVNVFCGFLWHLNTANPPLAVKLLDEALEDEQLITYFPTLQSSVLIDQCGLERLTRSLESGKVSVQAFNNLSFGRLIDAGTAASAAKFVLGLAQMPDGAGVAIHILHMQILSNNHEKREHAPELIAAGRELLAMFKFKGRDQRQDYDLDAVVDACASDEDGYAVAKAVCENLLDAVQQHHTNGFDHTQLLKALIQAQPMAVLDSFLGGPPETTAVGIRVLEDASYLQQNPMDHIGDEVLLKWCSQSPQTRFATVAAVISAFGVSTDHNPVGWAPRAAIIVYAAPDPIAVMRAFAERFRPNMWSGSRASILETNAKILDQFDARGNADLAAFIQSERVSILEEAKSDREWESKRDRGRDERFEY